MKGEQDFGFSERSPTPGQVGWNDPESTSATPGISSRVDESDFAPSIGPIDNVLLKQIVDGLITGIQGIDERLPARIVADHLQGGQQLGAVFSVGVIPLIAPVAG